MFQQAEFKMNLFCNKSCRKPGNKWNIKSLLVFHAQVLALGRIMRKGIYFHCLFVWSYPTFTSLNLSFFSSIFQHHKDKNLLMFYILFKTKPSRWNMGTSQSMLQPRVLNFVTCGILYWVIPCCGELCYRVRVLEALLACSL